MIGKPKLITSFLGKNVVKMACGGVHNLCLTQTEVPFEYEIFKLYKNELFTDVTLVLENFGSVNESNSISIKVHKFILSSRSKYFYNMFIKENNVSLVYKNFDEFVFRTIIDYLYIEDLGFIDEIKQTNAILDGLKLSKIFMLKKIEEKFEAKLKGILVRYSEALQVIDKAEGLNNVSSKNINITLSNQENQLNSTSNIAIGTNNNIITSNEGFSSDSSENQSIVNNNNNISDILSKDFKGLFFLPNGNPLIIFDDELIEKIMKSSNIINISDFNVNKESFNNYRVYSQKNNPQQTNIQIDSSSSNQNKFQMKKSNNLNVNNIVKQSSIKENVEIELNDSKMVDENQSVIEKKIKKKWVILFNEYIQEKISLLDYLRSMNIYHNFKLPKYLKFFNDKSSSDVILKVEGVEFCCHKVRIIYFLDHSCFKKSNFL